MLLRAKQKTAWGSSLKLPIAGTVKINAEDGTIKVTEEVAELLLRGDDWEVVETAIKAPKKSAKKEKAPIVPIIEEEDEEEEEEQEESEEEEEDEEEEEEENIQDELENMNLEEMLEMAKKANLKGYNLFKADANKMRAFLKKKLEA